ncbi:hypothetical protein GGF46_003909 [Coemansia sp. RSA 552]|nr:hypothetical protein GGF46_003909 [Coemansia sp. RSA 552]
MSRRMDDYAMNAAGRDSDIDVTAEEDGSSSGENDDLEFGGRGTRRDSETARPKEEGVSRKLGAGGDDYPETPYLPRLKTSIIQAVLNINAELVRLCQEYQNNSLMDDPQLVMYQMRLQSNLAYLASVGDHYMDPTRLTSPDMRPLPKPTLPACQGSQIAAKLAHARDVYGNYAVAWQEQQLELSRRAKARLHGEEKQELANLEREDSTVLHRQVEELLKKDRIHYDKSGDEPIAPESYRPFPPFRIPSEMRLPPGLRRWSFAGNVAKPEDDG